MHIIPAMLVLCLITGNAFPEQDVARLINPAPRSSSDNNWSNWAAARLDGNTAVIGFPWNSFYPENYDSGIVHIYSNSEGAWTWQQSLRPPALINGDDFGRTIAVRGNLLVVRANRNAVNDDRDAIYIYRRHGEQWSLEQFIPGLDDSFGIGDVAIAQGHILIVVSALPGDPTSVPRVAILKRANGQWTLTGYLPLPVLEAGNGYGASMAANDHWCVVGAPNAGENDEGRAFIYHRIGGEWELVQTVAGSPIDSNVSFGAGVEITSNEIAVYDPALEGPNQTHFGMVYIFQRQEQSQWSNTARIGPAISFGDFAIGDGVVASFAKNFDVPAFSIFIRQSGAWQHAYTGNCYETSCYQTVPKFGHTFALQNHTLLAITGTHFEDRNYAALVATIGLADLGDCDQNGLSDELEIALGNFDCDSNGVPDECDVDPLVDCNDNGLCDSFEINAWGVYDCNRNGVLDECEDLGADSDGDGTADACDNCELYNPDQSDCDGDGVGDLCAIADGVVEDCNENGLPDVCEQSYVHDLNQHGSWWVGNGSDFDCVSFQHFIAKPGEETINSISVRWSFPYPRPATLLLYRDPNNDGDPVDGELLWRRDIMSGARFDPYVAYQLEPTFVAPAGSHFFVAVASTGNFWPAEDVRPIDDSAHDQWFAAAPLFEFDPADLRSLSIQRPVQMGYGSWSIRASASPRAKCECVADLASNDDGGPDGEVNTSDLIALLASWGACGEPCPPLCAADLNGDCAVNVADLFFLLSRWGACE